MTPFDKMKRTRLKWILVHLVAVLLGLAYSDVCQPFTGSFDFSYGYIQRHQTPSFPVQRVESVLPVSNITSECCAFLDDFANEASRFIRCTIERSRPLRFCEQCVVPYERVTTVFNDIMKNTGGCHVFLLDADRVQAILQVHTMIQALWDASDCKNCFSSMGEDGNGTVSFQFNTDTLYFLQQYDNLTDCIEKYTNGTYPDFTFINYTVCSACSEEYRGLNLHFVSMRKTYSNKICMDLVDMMNYTRLMWGGERDLNCTRHLKDDMVVLLTSFILLTVPFLFYGASCICGKRRKLILMTQKRLKKSITVEVSFVNHHSETNNVNHS